MMRRRDFVFLLVLAVILGGVSTTQVRWSSEPSGLPAVALTRTHLGRQIMFEENTGQFDSRARFAARTPNLALFFTDQEIVLAGRRDVVRMRFDGGSKASHPIAAEPVATRTNYLVGSDRSKWRTGVANYARVRYEQLYAGIDLVFYGKDDELEYDLIVSPGADPSSVRMTLEGTASLAVSDSGDLVGHTTSGEIRFRKPVIYQRSGSERTRIDGHYVISDVNRVSFAVDDYDRTRALVIDPVVVYSTYLGGSTWEQTAGSNGGGAREMIAVDSTGAAYIAGRTESPVFPSTPGSWQSSAPTWIGVGFVTKIAPDGESIVYSTFIGGTTTTDRCGEIHYCAGVPSGIAVDSTGHAYVVGNVNGSDFPATPILSSDPDRAPFLLKLSPMGSSLVYGILFGNHNTWPMGVAVDSGGNAYVTGLTDFDSLYGAQVIGDNAIQPHCNCGGLLGGRTDAFVVKFNSTATAVLYATHVGGAGFDAGSAIALNSAGEAYISGATGSEDFPTLNAAQAIFGGGRDDFVVKLNASGTAIVFSTFLGGNGTESSNALGAAIAVDPAGNAYVTGYQNGSFPVTPGSFMPVPPQGGVPRAYVTKFTSVGQMAYSTFLTGPGTAFGTSIAVDAQGRAYVAGSASSGFPVTPDAFKSQVTGNDAFLSIFNPSGSALEFSTYIGGEQAGEFATGLALGPDGSVYMAGIVQANEFDFPTTPNAFQPVAGGGTDVFVIRIGTQLPDTEPPVINALSVNSPVLWPPNHTMRQVTVSVSASDDKTTSVSCSITNVSSNEPQLGAGAGDLAPDWQDTVDLTTWLRAERGGGRSGRLYTITVSCTDEAGNTASQNVGVSVPLNQGK